MEYNLLSCMMVFIPVFHKTCLFFVEYNLLSCMMVFIRVFHETCLFFVKYNLLSCMMVFIRVFHETCLFFVSQDLSILREIQPVFTHDNIYTCISRILSIHPIAQLWFLRTRAILAAREYESSLAIKWTQIAACYSHQDEATIMRSLVLLICVLTALCDEEIVLKGKALLEEQLDTPLHTVNCLCAFPVICTPKLCLASAHFFLQETLKPSMEKLTTPPVEQVS